MTQIRVTIETFCKVLVYNGIADGITAEIFRLAKFDKPEATGEMWIALKNLLLWLEIEGDISKYHFSNEDLLHFCKHKLYMKGYRAKMFYILPDNMECGSREVLLAFSWLMAKERVIQKMMTKIEHEDFENLPHRKCTCQNDLGNLDKFHITKKTDKLDKNEEVMHAFQSVTWIKGKIATASRSLLSARNEYSSLHKKIHNATSPFPPKGHTNFHLSLLDVYLLSKPKLLEEYQENLEKRNTYLQCLLGLKAAEASFWKWMDSVIELKVKEEASWDSDENDHIEEKLAQISTNMAAYKPSRNIQEIKQQHVKLSKLLQENEPLYKEVSKLQKRQKEILESTDEMKEQYKVILPYLDKKLQTEVEKLNFDLESSATLGAEKVTMFSVNFNTLRLVTSPKQAKRHHREPILDDKSGASREIHKMKEEIEKLKEKLRCSTVEQEAKIQELSRLLVDVVCIPP